MDRGPASFSFAYNGLGDRLRQTTDGASDQYTLDLNRGLTQVLADGESSYLYGRSAGSGPGLRLGEEGPDGWQHHLGDALGSVRTMAGGSAEVTSARAYEPFGASLTSTGPGASNYAFTGEWTDATGLIHLRARYYDPRVGRFFQTDPWYGTAAHPSTIHPYQYVENNSPNHVDPTGLYTIRQIIEGFKTDSYFDVLRYFKGGSASGQWGFLHVLHMAHDRDTIRIFQLHPMCGALENEALRQSPHIERPRVFVQGVLYDIYKEEVGEIVLSQSHGFLLVDRKSVGRPLPWFIPAADLIAYQPLLGGGFLGPRHHIWADEIHYSYRMLPELVDWQSFWSDVTDLSAFGIDILTLGKYQVLTQLLRLGATSIDLYRILEFTAPVASALADGRDPSPEDVHRLSREASELAFEEAPLEYQDSQIPLFALFSLARNLAGAVHYSP